MVYKPGVGIRMTRGDAAVSVVVVAGDVVMRYPLPGVGLSSVHET